MTLEALFEDLDASLERSCPITANQITAKANHLAVIARNQMRFSLVAPIVAKDFVAGLDEQTADWLCILKSQIAELRFSSDADASLPTTRTRALKLEQFLGDMPMPISVSLKTAQPAVRFAAIVAIGDGLLFLRARNEQVVAIGIDSIEFLRIIETADRNELQEWCAR
jgi:hypothetical protein